MIKLVKHIDAFPYSSNSIQVVSSPDSVVLTM